jgi:hypothetical protein
MSCVNDIHEPLDDDLGDGDLVRIGDGDLVDLASIAFPIFPSFFTHRPVNGLTIWAVLHGLRGILIISN